MIYGNYAGKQAQAGRGKAGTASSLRKRILAVCEARQPSETARPLGCASIFRLCKRELLACRK